MERAKPRVRAGWTLLGPAFVASLAYVDPGNVAANLTAGRQYGYQLVWVLAASSLMAMVIQYQSAKLGLVTGRSLPQVMAKSLASSRFSRPLTIAYGTQAFVVAVATDIAEVVGGALGLNLLFGTPLWLGGLIVGIVSTVLLGALLKRGERVFELAVSAILAIIIAGFLGTLVWAPVDWPGAAAGLLPRAPAAQAWPLVAAMLGATVMPHAIYLHSSLAIARHYVDKRPIEPLPRLLRLQKLDVGLALIVSGSVNIGMLLLAAAALRGLSGDTINVAHEQVGATLGSIPAAVFAIGLLASGLGSAVVGTHAGSSILAELHVWRASAVLGRTLTVGPAVVLLILGLPPTLVLVLSQIVLSFGIALAAAPLAWFTGDARLMGEHVDPVPLRVVNWLIVGLVVALNLIMFVTSFAG